VLSPAKVELAVLYWLWDLAEHDANAPTPTELARMFPADLFSIRRIEVALRELEDRGHAEQNPYPSEGVYRWQITRDGFGVVDRALRVPTSFIARTASDPSWLGTAEAEKAVLKKAHDAGAPLAAPAATAVVEALPSPVSTININNTFSPNNAQTVTVPGNNEADARSAKWAGWFGGWGAWVGALVALATLGWVLHEAKVF
jgi:hypothetical protein